MLCHPIVCSKGVNCSFKEAENSLCYGEERPLVLAERGGQGQSPPALGVRGKGHQRHHVGGPGRRRGGARPGGHHPPRETPAAMVDNKEIIINRKGTGNKNGKPGIQISNRQLLSKRSLPVELGVFH